MIYIEISILIQKLIRFNSIQMNSSRFLFLNLVFQRLFQIEIILKFNSEIDEKWQNPINFVAISI